MTPEPKIIPVEPFVMRGVGLTDVGVQRTQNEDAMYFDDFLGMYLASNRSGTPSRAVRFTSSSRLAVAASLSSAMRAPRRSLSPA